MLIGERGLLDVQFLSMMHHPKRQIRVIGIDDGPFTRQDKKVLVLGTIYRGGDFMDGLISTTVTRDGTDATTKIVRMIAKSKFHDQIQYVLLNGIAVAGFNVINVRQLYEKLGIPILIVVRRMPDLLNIVQVLRRLKMHRKIALIEQAGNVERIGNVWVQRTGMTKERAEQVLRITCTRSFNPEPIRIAHIIAAGIVKGESRGRA